MIALLLLIPAIICYSISQLQQHNKLKWSSSNLYDFWSEYSDRRKYKRMPDESIFVWRITGAKVNWYTRFFKIKYKERWLTSTNLTVFLTDGYHLCQFLFFLFLSLSITSALGFTWLLLLSVWILVHIIHFLAYKLFQK